MISEGERECVTQQVSRWRGRRGCRELSAISARVQRQSPFWIHRVFTLTGNLYSCSSLICESRCDSYILVRSPMLLCNSTRL